MKKTIIAALSCLMLCLALQAQEKKYIEPAEQDVKDNIANWQDYKFGMFIHWGIYAQLGCVESWSLCPQNYGWMYRKRKELNMTYNEYVNYYESQRFVFNPTSFDPNLWAEAAKYAGMKYMVFTTKHHDGFCMFDTKATDYKITSEECPFHTNPKANIAKEVFQAFRNAGITPSAYFSIADWHNDDYWWRFFPPKNTKVNYPVTEWPEKWSRFNDFMNQQLDELTGGEYGNLQMLWFDLCVPSEDGSAVVDWDRLAKTARGNQPGIMMVARSTGNAYENYLTPEQEIPDKALSYPWESCITMTYSWSYRPGAEYKSTKTMLDMLVKIVSRGGNLLLNVGPRPDGTLEETAYERLREIGDWMKVNSEGIYGTKAYSTPQDGKVYFTTKNGYAYAFYMADEDEKQMPASIGFNGLTPASSKAVTMLGTGRTLKWKADGKGGVIVEIPESVRKNAPCEHIWCLKIKL